MAVAFFRGSGRGRRRLLSPRPPPPRRAVRADIPDKRRSSSSSTSTFPPLAPPRTFRQQLQRNNRQAINSGSGGRGHLHACEADASAHSAITSYGNKRKILVLRVPSGARGPPCHQPITISLPKGPGAAWEAEGSPGEGERRGAKPSLPPSLSFWPHLAGIIGQISIYIIRCRWIPPLVCLMHAGRRGRRRGSWGGGGRPYGKTRARSRGEEGRRSPRPPDDPRRHQVARRKSHFLRRRLGRL